MKEMYPKNPDGMCSGPVYCKIAAVKINDLEASFSKAFLLICLVDCLKWMFFNCEILVLN